MTPPNFLCRLSLASLVCFASPLPAASPRPGKDRFADVPRLLRDKIPVGGIANADLKATDDAILDFMVAKGIAAASFALTKHGKLVHSRAFGWGDADLKTPLETGVSMRLASITKPITRAAIQTLIDAGKLKLDDHVFDVLALGKLASVKLDRRWKDVTIQHLLDHKGGWDREKAGDFTYRSKAICEELHIPLKKMEPMHLVKWALERTLDFDPGARSVYSNFGYILLARVVEKLSGQTFVEYLRSTVGQTAGMTTLMLSRSDPEDRLPGEVWYCLFPEYPRPESPWTLRVESKDGSGALACSAEDYCRFLDHYTVLGNVRRPGGRYSGTFFGSTPGVTSICSQRPDGIDYTVICNRRLGGKAGEEGRNAELKKAVDLALDGVAGKL